MDKETLHKEGIPGGLSVGSRNTNPGEPYEIAIIAKEVAYCPFVALPCGNGSVYGDADPALTEANARRLVACWNACVGIPTEDLEKGPATLANDRERRLTVAVQAFIDGWDHFCSKINFGASALDGKAIRFMNEVPGTLRSALTK